MRNGAFIASNADLSEARRHDYSLCETIAAHCLTARRCSVQVLLLSRAEVVTYNTDPTNEGSSHASTSRTTSLRKWSFCAAVSSLLSHQDSCCCAHVAPARSHVRQTTGHAFLLFREVVLSSSLTFSPRLQSSRTRRLERLRTDAIPIVEVELRGR